MYSFIKKRGDFCNETNLQMDVVKEIKWCAVIIMLNTTIYRTNFPCLNFVQLLELISM